MSPFNGYILEVVMYSSTVSSSDYTRLMKYFKDKYDMNPTGGYLMFATQGGATPGGLPHETYGDSSLYLLRGSDGINWPYVQPTNLLYNPGPGKSVFGVLQFSALKDQDGNLIKSDGRYWGEISRNTYWAVDPFVQPYTLIDIFSSTDLFNWDYENSFDFGSGGFNLGTEGFNDGWFKDNGNGKIYAKFNAGTMSSQHDQQEYSLEVTNLQHGALTFAGSPVHTTGSAIANGGGMYSSYTALVSATYCMLWNRVDLGTNQGNLATSSSALTGYNSNSSLGAGSTHWEWGQIVTLGAGSTRMYQDNEGMGMAYQSATDSCLTSPGGFSNIPNPTTASTTFVPQGGYVTFAPAGL